jgi:hypothetical protein
VLLGDGHGAFALAPGVALERYPGGLAAADFDGDGKADLAVASSDVELMSGNGDGTFAAPVRHESAAGALAPDDVDADGDTDLLHTLPASVSVMKNTTVVPKRTLTVTKAGLGAGTVTSAPAGIACGATCSADFAGGTRVKLQAGPDASSLFTGFSGEGCGGAQTCTVTMGQARAVTATFVVKRTVTVTKAGTGNGNGNGTVSSTPAGIACGATCSAAFADGTSVDLTATANASSIFAGFTGGGCTGAKTCAVTADQARSVTATFTAGRTLAVSKTGAGSGSVTSSPAGIACGATCSSALTDGATVTLTASADAGSLFTGFSGSGCSGRQPCTVTMSQARSVTASFAIPRTLTVAKAGAGTGSVVSSPAGIACGATCSADFGKDTPVELTAEPDANSEFTGFSGGGCNGSPSPTCTVTMDQARTVTATFVPKWTLTVTKPGSGSGSVISYPSRIECGATCSAGYKEGTQVTLQATPDPSSVFAGFSGACAGTQFCNVTMSEARTVTATFIARRTLSVSMAGLGAGTVSSTPAGLSCPGNCAFTVDDGVQLQLTAAPDASSTFSGFSGGGCTGEPTCTLTMDQMRAVTARFTAKKLLYVGKEGSGTVSSDLPGISCGTTCNAPFGFGSSVTLTASAATGSAFSGFWGSGCVAATACTVAMTQLRSVTAVFTAVGARLLATPLILVGSTDEAVTVMVDPASAPASVTLRGELRVAGRRSGTTATRRLRLARATRVKVTLPRELQRRIARAHRRGEVAKLRLTARYGHGSTSVTRRLTLGR